MDNNSVAYTINDTSKVIKEYDKVTSSKHQTSASQEENINKANKDHSQVFKKRKRVDILDIETSQ